MFGGISTPFRGDCNLIASLAFRNVLRNKERSLLTLVGVVLAIGSFVALVSLAAGFTQRVELELKSREVHVYVTVSRASTLPVSPLGASGVGGVTIPSELSEILNVEGVAFVTPIIRSSLDGPSSVIPVLALPLENVETIFKSGRFQPRPRDLAARAIDPQPEPAPEPKPEPSMTPGTEATPSPSPSTEQIDLKDYSDFEEDKPADTERLVYPLIVGQGLQRDVATLLADGTLVIEDMPFFKGADMGSLGFLDYTLLAPLDAFMAQRPERGVHEFWLTLEDGNRADQVRTEVDAKLQQYLAERELQGEYAGARRIKVLTKRQYLRAAKEHLGYGWLLQVAVSMVGVLIAITASMNTMLMSTYERLGEYATLRAIGASRRVISLTIIFEAIFLNVTGGVLGLAFGYLATGVLDKAVALVLEIPYPLAGVTPALLLQALVLSFCVGLVGALIPCFIVSRIDLVAQLRKGL